MAFGSAATPSAGPMVTVRFNKSYGSKPAVAVTPGHAASAGLGFYVDAWDSGNGFTVFAANAPDASQAASTYLFHYIVIG